ncbi:uncharacterized protein EV420DRAFT_1557010 [Desarmillaria tabescens]|uniref:Uncharacterized protein n=1 Tax=Armillaria tabescens TaxID=1929756 RepID=A0AA39N0X4_ARMTA|nr:uncharacterized protein EV420DRAFT_1557010 [Desarmillaria tabescens]KAK0454141.1 hypothetical protein EV420DRAFT_1557010 [Desarmillaria tabescens]
MAPVKSAKVAKYTYAERVLTSMTQLQREHKKQAINLVSLRAHVKKIAEKKNDRLGPNWSNWVGRAVGKLEDDGVLIASGPGCVTLTPRGKKAITAARRSILSTAPPGTLGSPAQEDLVTRLAVKDRGTKRPLRKSLAVLDTNAPSSPNGPRAKRMRVSRDAERTPISKMTKAQLKAELASVKKAHELALLRATSPLTDLSDAEGRAIESERLQEELKEREQEIAYIRAELEDARRQAEPSGPQSPMGNRTEPPTPMSPCHAARLRRTHPGGVTRTQSGTIIPDISRHPTPPSSPPNMEYGNMREDDSDIPDIFSSSLMPHTGNDDEDDSRTNRQESLDAVETAAVLNAKVTALQRDLDLRSGDLRNTNKALNEHRAVLEEFRTKNAALTKQNDDIAHQLSAFKMTAQDETQKNAALIDDLNCSIQNLRSDNSLLKNSKVELLSTNAALLDQVKQLESALDESKSTQDSLRNDLKLAQEEAATAKAEAGALKFEKAALLTETNHYKAEMEKALSEEKAVSSQRLDAISRIKKEQAELTTSFKACGTELEAKNVQIKDLSATLQAKILLLDDSSKKIETMQEDLHKTIVHGHDTLESLRAEKDSRIREMEQVTAAGTLRETQALLSGLRSDLDTQITATNAARSSFEQEQIQVVSLRDELVGVKDRAEAAEEEVIELRSSKRTDEATISSLKAMFERLKTAQMVIFNEFEGQVTAAGPSPSSGRKAVFRS